jgi:hypothetical protein
LQCESKKRIGGSKKSNKHPKAFTTLGKRAKTGLYATRRNRVVVRGRGLEPLHHCWRQDLNLVRLPISPSSLKGAAIKRSGARACLKPPGNCTVNAVAIYCSPLFYCKMHKTVCVFYRTAPPQTAKAKHIRIPLSFNPEKST